MWPPKNAKNASEQGLVDQIHEHREVPAPHRATKSPQAVVLIGIHAECVGRVDVHVATVNRSEIGSMVTADEDWATSS